MDMNPENTTDRIHRKLTEAFAPKWLEVIDESAKHAGHVGSRSGGETHFRVKIASDFFIDMTKVVAHRAIYQILSDDMKEGGIHALALEVWVSFDKENFAH
jgi:BolA protein